MVAIMDTERLRSTAVASHGKSGNGGGTVDDTQRRLSVLESLVSGIRADVSAVMAILSHLATKAELKEEAGALQAEFHNLVGVLHAREIRMIQWFVGTNIAMVAAVFSIVRYLPE